MGVMNSGHVVFISLSLALLATCCDDSFKEEVIYTNNFEDVIDPDFTGVQRYSFNSSTVLGPFNNGSIDLELPVPGGYNYLLVELDLYIHDTWDGNEAGRNGPDLWGIDLTNIGKFKNYTEYGFQTTFSNSYCSLSYCKEQSFPETFPANYDAKEASLESLIAGCTEIGTTLYRLEKLIPVSRSKVRIRFYDQLKQIGVADGVCDESWSMDNLMITAIMIDK